jgi:hypothetical protein
MANDKRADIAILRPGMKLVIELKRDRHGEVWTAIETQLERFYARDPDAHGYGIYGVFWFGDPSEVRTPPRHASRPSTVVEMQSMLSELVPKDRAAKVVPLVIDVSGHIP